MLCMCCILICFLKIIGGHFVPGFLSLPTVNVSIVVLLVLWDRVPRMGWLGWRNPNYVIGRVRNCRVFLKGLSARDCSSEVYRAALQNLWATHDRAIRLCFKYQLHVGESKVLAGEREEVQDPQPWGRFQEGPEGQEPGAGRQTTESWGQGQEEESMGAEASPTQRPGSVGSSPRFFNWLCWGTLSSVIYKCTITYWNKSEIPFSAIRLLKVIFTQFLVCLLSMIKAYWSGSLFWDWPPHTCW